MTDLSTPAPLFEIQFRSEPVETAMFGTVTIHEIGARRIAAIYAQNPPDTSGDLFGFTLLCDTATGANGERFTVEILENLPNRALRDMATLLRTAIRINGIDKDEVEKA